MAIYAKIDEQGNVLEFPYRLNNPLQITQIEVPQDVIEVDTTSLKPVSKWNEKLMYDKVIKSGDSYQLLYKVEPKYKSLDEKKFNIQLLKQQYLNQNKEQFKSKVKELQAKYPDEEILSWDIQVKEAEQFLQGSSMSGSMIQILADIRGISLEELVNRILTKKNIFNQSYAIILATFQRNNDLLDSINEEDDTTYDYIDQYGWNNV